MSAMKPHLFLPILALGLLLAAPLHAQTAPHAIPEPAPEAQDDAPTEGIHVSGEWTLTVYDADGALVERHKFNNALTPEGGQTISKILTSNGATGQWIIGVGAAFGAAGNAVEPCASSSGDRTQCAIVDESDTSTEPGFFKNLQVTMVDDTIVLSGSITIQHDNSEIVNVVTLLGSCPPDISPDNCSITDQFFSRRDLSTTNESLTGLEAGQIVSVEVVIGFN